MAYLKSAPFFLRRVSYVLFGKEKLAYIVRTFILDFDAAHDRIQCVVFILARA